MDAAIVAVGSDVFKPSDIVTRSAQAIVDAPRAHGIARYAGITGVAQMQARRRIPPSTRHLIVRSANDLMVPH
jgi:hypothetical protein